MQWLLYLLAILVAVVVGFFTWKSDKLKAVPYPLLTASLRGLLFFLTILLLLSPFFSINKNRTIEPHVLFLQDNSASIAYNLKSDTAKFRALSTTLLSKLKAGHQVQQIAFDHRTSKDSLFSFKGSSTDIALALASLPEYADPSVPTAIILATDGHYNVGENPVFQTIPLRAHVYVVALGDTTLAKDISLPRVYANEVVSVNSQFEVTVDLVALQCAGYTGQLKIVEQGNVINSNEIKVSSNRYDQAISFTIPTGKAGWRRFSAIVTPAEGEDNKLNNQRDFFVNVVEDQKKILLAAFAPHPDIAAIKAALKTVEKYKLTTLISPTVPATDGYDAVILHQLPAMGATSISNKPSWFILGKSSNVQEIGKQSKLFTAMPGGEIALSPSINSSFNYFPFAAGAASTISRFPPLTVSIANYKAGPGSYSPLLAATANTPLWLLQPGPVPMAATMGEGLWRWRMYEFQQNKSTQVVDELIRQTVSFLTANAANNAFRVEMNKNTWKENEGITFNGYLLNANNEQVNTTDAQLTLTDSAGKRSSYTFDKLGTGYHLNIGSRAAGQYSYIATTNYNGKRLSDAGNFIVDGQAVEYLYKGADYNMLASLAQKYQGSAVTLDGMAALYDSITRNKQLVPVLEEGKDHVPLIEWRWFFLIILLVAATEWLLRKYWMAH